MSILDYIEKIKQENESPRITIQEPRTLLAEYKPGDDKMEQTEVLRPKRIDIFGNVIPAETLETWEPNPFLKPHAEGGRIGYDDGQLVQNTVDGSRPGYKGADYKLPTTKDRSQKYTKKFLADLRKDLPPGLSLEETRKGTGQWNFKVLIKGGNVGKDTIQKSAVANLENKKILSDFVNKKTKEYYPNRLTDTEFKNLRLKNKNMTTEDFAKFLNDKGKTTYWGEEWNKGSVSHSQTRLDIGKGITGPYTVRTVDEAKTIIRKYPGAKIFFAGKPTDVEITQYAANLLSQEKTVAAKGKNFPVGSTKEQKMFHNFYQSSKKSDGRIQLTTKIPKDADGNIDWKMKDKDGTHAWKKAEFYDNKTGATYTWGKDYKPGNLRKQVDNAYGDGFFAKSVKTYDEQAKWNKKTFGGKALNEWMREGLLKKELELKIKRKLTSSPADKELLKEFYKRRKPSFSFTEAHHVEGVGKNPFRMELSYRAANRKQGNLQSSYSAGKITKEQYIKEMENLSDTKGGIKYKTEGRFIGQTGTPERIVATGAKEAGLLKNKDFIKFFKDTFQDLSPQSVLQLAKKHNCGKFDEGGSVITCLQTKFNKDPQGFLQRSAPLAADGRNANLLKWLKRGRSIARGTGVLAAWEAVFAPIIAAPMYAGGESAARIWNEIAYGVPFIGETEKEELQKYMGDQGYKLHRLHEITGEDVPTWDPSGEATAYRPGELGPLYQDLPGAKKVSDAIKKSKAALARGPVYMPSQFDEKQIEGKIKAKELEMQDLWNKLGLMEGPAGQEYNWQKIREAYDEREKGLLDLAMDKHKRRQKRIESGIVADPNWYKQEGRTSRMGGGMVGIRKPHAIPPEKQGLRSIMIDGMDD